jgi:DNA-binding NtrC family response regulator
VRPFTTTRVAGEVKEFAAAPRPVMASQEVTPMDIQQTFTLSFSLGTTMREIHDAVIQKVLESTQYNRLRAAALLKINPRTIRRRLGKKDGSGSSTRAA